MKCWLDFGPANTGLTITDLTCYAFDFVSGNACTMADATLTEMDGTNLPGLYLAEFPNIGAGGGARGKAWKTTDPNVWDVIRDIRDEIGLNPTNGLLDNQLGAISSTTNNLRNAVFPMLGVLSQFSAQISGWNFTTGVFTASFSETIPAGGKIYCCPYSATNGSPFDEPWEIAPPDVLTVNDVGANFEQILALCIQGGTAASTPAGTLTMTCTDCKTGDTTQTITISTPAVAQGDSSYFFVTRDGTCYATGGVPQGSGAAMQMPDGDFYAEANP